MLKSKMISLTINVNNQISIYYRTSIITVKKMKNHLSSAEFFISLLSIGRKFNFFSVYYNS